MRPKQVNSNQAIQIVLYTKAESSESRHLKKVLRENGYAFVEQDGGRADVILELQKRLGRFVDLPGLLVDGKKWIAESAEESWIDGLDKYCLSKLLNSTANPPPSSCRDEIFFRPLPPQHDHHPGYRHVQLPDGTSKTVLQLTNELVQHHQYDGIVFEGDRAIDVYKRYYGAETDGQAIRFGYSLVGFGILVIVASNPAGFGDSQVRLFATQRGRNTIVPWPGRKLAKLGDSLRLLQSILRTLNKIDQPGDPQRRLRLIQELELDVCALQNCSLHKSSELFLLQLFNVMIRHYSVSHALPTTLPEVLELHETIGYRIDGQFVTAAQLRTWLLQGSSDAKLPRVVESNKAKGKRWKALRCKKATRDDEEEGRGPPQHSFSTSFVTTDPRLIFAMAWTTGMGLIEAPLDRIVCSYCQSHIVICNNTVYLPPLLRWFRNDFGKTPEAIIHTLRKSLPIGLRLQMQTLQAEGHLQFTFRNHPIERRAAPVDLDEERTCGEQSSALISCYIDGGGTISDHNTMDPMSVMGGMSMFSLGHQSGGRSMVGRPNSMAKMQSMSAIGGSDATTTAKTDSDGDTTRSTTEESSSLEGQNQDDYANWFQSEMSVITYGSDFDVLVNEAYLQGGEVEDSQRDISFLQNESFRTR